MKVGRKKEIEKQLIEMEFQGGDGELSTGEILRLLREVKRGR